ncbi:nucleotidyl transferase AbiEii/AbiGii toxin family protein [Kitasatospora sp. NPDC050543]|uniref:nucleotidyl transferase AbiEii/AbiGii toxin family protein n=1 Tax=Kitasatospora sp. NPDC050543 TaxID=3364054 RepID=UPI0037A0ECCC
MTPVPAASTPALQPDLAHFIEIALPVCDRFGLALAGGGALRAHGLAACPPESLTLVMSGTTDLPGAAAELARAYRAADCEVTDRPGTPRAEQLSVQLPWGGGRHLVYLRKEPLAHQPVRLPLRAHGRYGTDVSEAAETTDLSGGFESDRPGSADGTGAEVPVVALDDAAALTTLLLADRGMPRDLVDVHALTACFRPGELLALATALDAEFQPAVLADRLDILAEAADGRYRARDLDAEQIAELRRWALEWAQDLRLDLLETQERPDGLHDPYLEGDYPEYTSDDL